MKPLLLVDAAINVVLGVLLCGFWSSLIPILGLPPAATGFYPFVLGAVLFGIGVALVVEAVGRPRRLRGLGLEGAVAINVCGASALVYWLIRYGSEMTPLGRYVVAGIGVIVLATTAAEIIGRRRRQPM